MVSELGLADAFAKMDVSFHSSLAKQINRNIFETMYHAALEASMEASKEEGLTVHLKGLLTVKVFYNLICGMLLHLVGMIGIVLN